MVYRFLVQRLSKCWFVQMSEMKTESTNPLKERSLVFMLQTTFFYGTPSVTKVFKKNI